MTITERAGGGLILGGLPCIDIAKTFDCGQCFRFDPIDPPDGYAAAVRGVFGGRLLTFLQEEGVTDSLTVYGCDAGYAERVLPVFLGLDFDYDAAAADIFANVDAALGYEDGTIRRSAEAGCGIRILRQDPWETLISFIISANNNIPRIKKIIRDLCAAYGEPIYTDADGIPGNNARGDANTAPAYSFPAPEALRAAGIGGLAALKTGFRAKYIYDAACRVCGGELDLEAAAGLPTSELLSALQSVKGVGPKVASCIALFAYGRTDAFPVDVWIKRVLAKYYPEHICGTSFGCHAGIAQQWLFYRERYINGGEK